MSAALSPAAAATRPVGVGGALEQRRVFLEFLPRQLADVVRKPIDEVAQAADALDQAFGHQTLHDTIVNAQHAGARLLRHVEPQHLLFIFGERTQVLAHAHFVLPLDAQAVNLAQEPAAGFYAQQGHTAKQPQPDDGAVVFCYCPDAQQIEQLGIGQPQKGKHGGHCYQVAWLDLERIQHRLEELDSHLKSVGAQA